MSLIGVIACAGASLAALTALAATDPKRRRAFRLPALAATPDRRPLWAAALAPGALAAFTGGGGGFVLWFGAAAVAGWGLAALSPERTEPLAQRVAKAQARLALPRPVRRPKARALERRVAALEAELAALRAERRAGEDQTSRRKPEGDPHVLRTGRAVPDKSQPASQGQRLSPDQRIV